MFNSIQIIQQLSKNLSIQLLRYNISHSAISFNMEATRQQKQKFLFSEIIEKGYEPQDFQEYLYEMNESQINLDQWSFPDLKKAVEKYQQKKALAKSKQNSSDPSDSEKIESNEEIQMRPKEETTFNLSQKDLRNVQKMPESGRYLEFNYQTKHETFSQTIDCIQVPPSSMLKQNVDIKIIRFDKKEGGVFQQSYVSYIIETPCLQKTVERRYNDFLWLKTTLERLHPGMPIPPIAKKGQYRRYDDKHLNKRRMILEKFLNKLVQIPEVKADQVLENFLKFDDLVTFEKFKSQFKGQGSIKLSAIKNTKGKLNLVIDPKTNNFLVKAQRHILETQPMMKKLQKQHKNAATMLQNCSQTFRGIAKLCQGMDAIQQGFRKQAELKYCKSNTFTILMDSSIRLADVLASQATLFRTEVYSCIKYESLNMLNILDAFDKLKSYKQQYVQAKNSLFRKKQKLFEEGNPAKWGINPAPTGKPNKIQIIQQMLPKQTEDLARLRVRYALRNFHTYQQINRHYLKNNIYMAKYLMKYTKLQSQLSSELMMIWVDAQTQVMGMQEGKSIQDVYIGK